MPISQVKPLLGQPAMNAEPSNWQQQVDELMACCATLNAGALHQRLDQLTSLYPFGLVNDKVLQPWLNHSEQMCQQRVDGELLQAWLQEQIQLRFYTRWQLANQSNQGESVYIISVGQRSWWQPLLQANQWALAGYKVSLLKLQDLSMLLLASTDVTSATLLFDLPSQLSAQQKQLMIHFTQQGYLIGEFAALHQPNLGLALADSRNHKENWQ